MPNAFTSTDSATLGGTVGSAGLVQKAYDRLVEFELRAQPLIRSVADKRPARQAMPGSSVVLQTYNDLDTKTSTLSETVDPDSVALATPNQVTITLNEYGNAALVTRKLQLFSLADVDPAVANIIAFNMADSIDEVAQAKLITGTNVIRPDDTGSAKSLAYNTGAVTDIDGNDTLTAASIRLAIAKLRANKAVARKGSLYWCGIHPEVSHDLRAETGAGSWRNPHEYQSNSEIWAGEIGQFEGAYFIESPRLYNAKDGGTGTTFTGVSATGSSTQFTLTIAAGDADKFRVGDAVSGSGVGASAKVVSVVGTTVTLDVANTGSVTTVTVTPATRVFRTILAGKQALAEAVSEEPHVVIGPVTDKLMRFRPIGWYGVLGFEVYRNEALMRIESTSSINNR